MATPFNQTNISDLYLPKFEKGVKNVFDTKTPFMAMLKKRYDLQGSYFEWKVRLSQAAGVGATDGSSLPTATNPNYDSARVTPARLYGIGQIDRFAIHSARSEGAVVDAIKRHLADIADGVAHHIERALLTSDAGSVAYRGSGKLGALASSASVTGSNPYTFTMDASTYNKHKFEVGMLVNIESGNTDPFEVTAITDTQLTVSRLSGSQVPANSDEVFVQGSEDSDILSAAVCAEATSGSLFNISVGSGWQATQVAAGSAALSPDLLTETVLDLDQEGGGKPTVCVVAPVHWRQLASQFEDLKRIEIKPRNEKLAGKAGFSALEFVGPTGSFPIISSKYVDTGKAYLFDMDDMCLDFTSESGFVKDDTGSIFLRDSSADYFSCRWAGYLNLKLNPPKHAVITGLSTS